MFFFQDVTSVSVEFVEESDPILLAEDFNLQDFDSPDTPVTNLTVTLTLTETIDVASEGVRLETSGDVVMVEQDSEDEHIKVYTLTNGSSFSQYEEVC